ncbi:hypothetical protein MMC30_003117 [Trapelia coarctata]|nr:hypothetical protein [Trapelia coarctata]
MTAHNFLREIIAVYLARNPPTGPETRKQKNQRHLRIVGQMFDDAMAAGILPAYSHERFGGRSNSAGRQTTFDQQAIENLVAQMAKAAMRISKPPATPGGGSIDEPAKDDSAADKQKDEPATDKPTEDQNVPGGPPFPSQPTPGLVPPPTSHPTARNTPAANTPSVDSIVRELSTLRLRAGRSTARLRDEVLEPLRLAISDFNNLFYAYFADSRPVGPESAIERGRRYFRALAHLTVDLREVGIHVHFMPLVSREQGNTGGGQDVVLDPAVQEILRGLGFGRGNQNAGGSQNVGEENTAEEPADENTAGEPADENSADNNQAHHKSGKDEPATDKTAEE